MLSTKIKDMWIAHMAVKLDMEEPCKLEERGRAREREGGFWELTGAGRLLTCSRKESTRWEPVTKALKACLFLGSIQRRENW